MKLKTLRLAAGLSQKQLADKAGVDQAMVSKIELHNQNPSLEMLRRIARGLDCSVVDLLDEEDKESPRKTAA